MGFETDIAQETKALEEDIDRLLGGLQQFTLTDDMRKAIANIRKYRQALKVLSPNSGLFSEIAMNVNSANSIVDGSSSTISGKDSLSAGTTAHVDKLGNIASIIAPLANLAELLALTEDIRDGKLVKPGLAAAKFGTSGARAALLLAGKSIPGLDIAVNSLDLISAVHDGDKKRMALSSAALALVITSVVASQGAVLVPFVAAGIAVSATAALVELEEHLSGSSQTYASLKWHGYCLLANRDPIERPLAKVETLTEEQQAEIQEVVSLAKMSMLMIDHLITDELRADIEKTFKYDLDGSSPQEYAKQLAAATLLIKYVNTLCTAQAYLKARDAYRLNGGTPKDVSKDTRHFLELLMSDEVKSLRNVAEIMKGPERRALRNSALKELKQATNTMQTKSRTDRWSLRASSITSRSAFWTASSQNKLDRSRGSRVSGFSTPVATSGADTPRVSSFEDVAFKADEYRKSLTRVEPVSDISDAQESASRLTMRHASV